MSVPFASQPGISGIFGRMESAPGYKHSVSLQLSVGKPKTNRYIIARLNSHRQFRGPGGRRHLQGNACVMSSLVSKTFKIAPNLEFFMSLRS